MGVIIALRLTNVFFLGCSWKPVYELCWQNWCWDKLVVALCQPLSLAEKERVSFASFAPFFKILFA